MKETNYGCSERKSLESQSNKPKSNTWNKEKDERDNFKNYRKYHKTNGHTIQECYDFQTYLYSKYYVEKLSRREESPLRSYI